MCNCSAFCVSHAYVWIHSVQYDYFAKQYIKKLLPELPRAASHINSCIRKKKKSECSLIWTCKKITSQFPRYKPVYTTVWLFPKLTYWIKITIRNYWRKWWSLRYRAVDVSWSTCFLCIFSTLLLQALQEVIKHFIQRLYHCTKTHDHFFQQPWKAAVSKVPTSNAGGVWLMYLRTHLSNHSVKYWTNINERHCWNLIICIYNSLSVGQKTSPV